MNGQVFSSSVVVNSGGPYRVVRKVEGNQEVADGHVAGHHAKIMKRGSVDRVWG